MILESDIKRYMDIKMPLDKLLILVPHNYTIEQSFDDPQDSSEGSDEFIKTTYGDIKVRRHNAITKPILVDIISSFTVDDDITYR